MQLTHHAPPLGRHTSAAGRHSRFAAYVIAALLLAFGLLSAAIVLPPALTTGLHVTWGMDFRAYLEHAERWLAGGGFYLPEQLAGPYIVEDITGAVYPPVLLYLLVPFVYGLPWAVWWAVPLVVVGAAIAARRPSPWQCVALALILVYPRTWTIVVLGNPAMWALAALTAGMVWTWPLVGVALKATFAPLALLGVRHRSWWRALAVALLLAVPFGAMWLDYLAVLVNTQTSRGPEYTLGEWPVALLLVVGLWRGGWWTATREHDV
jgi:hypothetical protein